ncbi:MAG: hypothetical protein WB493_01390 [Anaeromyxobacteraceae bacterium]
MIVERSPGSVRRTTLAGDAQPTVDGKLLLGYLDLLSAKEGNVVVVDL